jgi:5-methylcytosine-specific restriction enzyme subunit McrC
MIEIEVAETGPGAEYTITAAEAASMVASRFVSVSPLPSGRWLVSGTGKVGVVQIGDVTVRVIPKLPIKRIFYLMGYGRGFVWRDDLVPYDTATDLVHVLADAFVRQADRALGRGVIQGYVERDDELAVVRGRMRYREQVTRRFGQITPLLVRYDDFTIDVAENQLVRAAAKVLRRVPGLDPMISRRLRAIIQRLDDVSDLIPGAPRPVWQSDRRNAHYETVLWFASMVLKNRAIDLPAGAVDVNGFVIDMATVFEDFVTATLTDSLERIDGRVRPQDPQPLDVGGTVKMAPDLVWYRGGKPVAVFDAKYKVEKVAGYPNADLYQMLAYCTALGLPVGHLVYAKGNEPEQTLVVRGSKVEIVTQALDLDQLPADLLAQVESLAERVASGASAARAASLAWAPPQGAPIVRFGATP